jgi:hypothetical protein
MTDGYTVVPESLLDMVEGLRNAHLDWADMRDKIDGLTLDTLSLGILGELSNYSSTYNDVKDVVADKLTEGYESLHSTARTLEQVAKFYNEKDAEYYEQFGYLASEVG